MPKKVPNPTNLMWLLFVGFSLSFAFCLLSTGLIMLASGPSDAKEFFILYVKSFNTLITLGLILGTVLIVRSAQDVVPEAIERSFTHEELLRTEYFDHKRRYYSVKRAVTFAAEMVTIGFVVLIFCRFPLSGIAEILMMLAGCAQWALASYVGRKLRYAAMMLHSLLGIPVQRNLFKERALDMINVATNAASTLTIIFVYVHIRGYYGGPFRYDSLIGDSAQVFLLLPAIIAAPVLLMFNFFPRHVLRRIYGKSIDVEVRSVRLLMKEEQMTPLEKRLCLMELDKMYREEVRYSLQLTLSDLPIGITILLMVVEPLVLG